MTIILKKRILINIVNIVDYYYLDYDIILSHLYYYNNGIIGKRLSYSSYTYQILNIKHY